MFVIWCLEFDILQCPTPQGAAQSLLLWARILYYIGAENIMRRLLVLISVGLLLGCASSTKETFDAPPSAHDECVYGCENEYSSCILDCEKTRKIGSGLDACTEQCKATWAECNEEC